MLGKQLQYTPESSVRQARIRRLSPRLQTSRRAYLCLFSLFSEKSPSENLPLLSKKNKPLKLHTDTQIIEAIRDNRAGIAKLLYLRYREPFFAWARPRYRANHEDLADSFQEAIIVFYQNVQEGKITELRSSIKTYLFGVGKNLLLKRYDKNKRYLSTDADDAPEIEGIDVSLEERYDLTHRQKTLQRAFALLGENCRELLTFFYYRNFDNEEIARRMDYKNTDTVKSRKRNCMVKLEKILEEKFKEELY